MAVALVGSVTSLTRTTAGTTITAASWAQSPTAGNLLVAVITRVGSTATASPTSTGATGWTRLLPTSFVTNIGVGSSTACTNLVDVWYKAAAGGDTIPVFTMTNAGGSTFAMNGAIYELSGANTSSPLDTSGTASSGGTSSTITSTTTTTSGNVAASGGFAISAATRERTAGTTTVTYSASWTNGANDGATSSVAHTGTAYLANPASGATASDVTSWSGTGTTAFGAGAIVVIAPAPTQGTAAIAGAGTVTAAGTSPAPLSAITQAVGGRVFVTRPGHVQASLIPPQAAQTITGTAAVTGAGTVTAVITQGATATLAGAGTVAATSGSLTAGPPVPPLTQPAGTRIIPARTGHVQALPGFSVPVIIQGSAFITGLGTLTATPGSQAAGPRLPPLTQAVGGRVYVTRPGHVQATAIPPPAGATITGTASIAGTGTLTASSGGIVPGTCAITGSGTVTGLVTQGSGGTIGGSGTVGVTAVQGVTASLAGTGTLAALVTQQAAAAIAGAGTAGAAVTGSATAAIAATGTLTAAAAQQATAAITGTGTVTALPGGTGAGTAAITGAGTLTAAVTQQATAQVTGSGTVTAAAAQRAPAAITGTATVTAAGAIAGTAAIAGTGSLAAKTAQAATVTITGAGAATATAVLGATAAITGTGQLAAAATSIAPTVFGTASIGGGTLTAATPGGQPAAAATATGGTLATATPGGKP